MAIINRRKDISRNNLLSNTCPLCGHEYTLGDVIPPKLTLKEMFGYHENNFYGDKIKLFTKGKCCREYYLYLMAKDPSYIVKDIEPVDYEAFVKDLDTMIKRDEEKEVKEVEEKPIDLTEIITEKELTGRNISEYKYHELMKIAKDKYGTLIPKGTKFPEVKEWFATNTNEV